MKYLIGGLVGVAAASIVWYIVWMMHANKMKKAAEENQKEINRLKALIPASTTPTTTAPVVVVAPTGTTATAPATSGITATAPATSGTTAQRMYVKY